MYLSIVIPLYNESDNLHLLHARLQTTLDRIGCDYELIFVNDGSTDGSLSILEDLADRDSRVKFLSLSRNFGHEIASTAGLDVADGDAVVLMDADLQDPPELIERFLEPWQQGYDVVYGRRRVRLGESWFKRVMSHWFYRIMCRLSNLELPLDTGDFRLMDRRVVESFRQFSESQRFVRGLVTWMGFRQTAVEYDRPGRHRGVGKYSFCHLFGLAADAFLGFSILPLRLATLLGILCIGGALLAGAIALGHSCLAGMGVSSAAVTNFCLVFFSGVQLVGLGIVGEYVGRIHRDGLRRPLYLLDRQRGWPNSRLQPRDRRERTQSARMTGSRSSPTRQPAA